jgi:hypothetical protein
MDLIFIDGGKSYAEVKSDWENSRTLMHDGTAVFVHNHNFSGVRRMIDTISREEYQVKIIHTPFDADTAIIKKKSRKKSRDSHMYCRSSLRHLFLSSIEPLSPPVSTRSKTC